MLALLLSISGPAPAAEKTASAEIVFGFPEFPPLSFANAQGEPDGYLVHLTSAMFERAGLRSRAMIFPAPRLFENLATGAIDFSMVVHNPVLDDCCVFSKKAVVRDELRVYRKTDKPPVKNKDALAGKHIIVIQGFSYAGLIKFINDKSNRITSEVAPSHGAAFAMLDAGRADYVVDYAGPAASGLAEHPIKNLQSEQIDYLDIYMVLSKRYPDAEQLLERLTRLVAQMQEEPAFHPPGQNLQRGR
ncbi:MAG: transporter substrate-binding domain-containing protein [Burkholderiales bacterium]|nr:transporter substrate-binding domain-containing protein [Burkholderiales bacterium]